MTKVRAVLAICLVVSATAGTSFASQASASMGECPSGWLCLWENNGYSGRMLKFQDSGSWQNMATYNFDNKASSIWNNTNRDAQWAQGANGGAPTRCLQPNEAFAAMPGNWNDMISSVHLYNSANFC